MKGKDALTPKPEARPRIKTPNRTRVTIYKFRKTSGKNCGPLEKTEERDRSQYDYSDEL